MKKLIITCGIPGRPIVEEMTTKLINAYTEAEKVFTTANILENQKDFAKFVLTSSPFHAIMFTTRKTKRSFAEVWRESKEVLLKVLFKE